MREKKQIVEINIDDLLPHRNGMKLVSGIVEVNEHCAVTESRVKETWPMVEGGFANPLILIELAAQTAGIFLGWRELQKKGKKPRGKGWLVGVKEACFHTGGIPVGSRITTRVEGVFDFEDCHEISGILNIGGDLVGQVSVQIVKLVEG